MRNLHIKQQILPQNYCFLQLDNSFGQLFAETSHFKKRFYFVPQLYQMAAHPP